MAEQTREQKYETVVYQVSVAVLTRPCGPRPCDQEFPGMPSRWCSGCLLAAAWNMRNGERERWIHVKAQRDELLTAAENTIAAAESEGWIYYKGTDESRLRVLEEALDRVESGWPAGAVDPQATEQFSPPTRGKASSSINAKGCGEVDQ